MHSKHISTIAFLASCTVYTAALHGITYGQEPQISKVWQLFEELDSDKLPAERRTEILVSLIDEVGGYDGDNILHVLGKQMKKHAVARKVVLPRFAELISSARQGYGHIPRRRLCRVLNALLTVGEAPPEAVAEAEAVLKDAKDHPFAAPKAAALLLCVDPTRRDVQQWLAEKLQSKNREERMRAAAALGATGKRAEVMVAKLQPLLKDEAVEVRVMAARSLWKIDTRSPNVASVLQESLREKPMSVLLEPISFSSWNPDHRHLAVIYLGQMGTDAKEAASDIARLLKDDDKNMHWFAAQALGPIGVRTPDVLSALEAAKGDSNVAVSKSAAESLEMLTRPKASPSAKP